jgi:DNA repair exonuclease SbcCD ATPase subunit
MILKRLKIRNFRSFGNNTNELIFDTENGNLILMLGKNGEGKTSVLKSLDFALYGFIKNNGSKITNSKLPNRINKNLEVEIEYNIDNTDININRKVSPDSLTLKIDNVLYETKGKSNIQDKINTYLPFEYDTWSSFISMSVNDFKNFASLRPEEKRLLLDKLFNMDMINDINKILKDKKKLYTKDISLFNSEILAYEKSLKEFKKSIDNIQNNNNEYNKNKKEENIVLFNSKKIEYIKIKDERLSLIATKDLHILELDKIKNSLIELKHNIKTTEEKLELFNNDKCPTCKNDLSDVFYDTFKLDYNDKLISLKNLQVELLSNKKEIDDNINKVNDLISITDETFSDMSYYLKSLKSEIDNISFDNSNINIDDLLKSVENIEKEEAVIVDKLSEIKKEEDIYDKMIRLFSNDDIKKDIIRRIIKPLNIYIKENVDLLGLDFNIHLDENFDANIENRNEEIDWDTLSTGETKKVNLAIMVAYLKLIRKKKHINVLFLDEIFASIDIEGIEDVLLLLKDFAKTYKINIFIIHHDSNLDKNVFDKVYLLQKNIVSNIIEM